jgi:hypothetical protein
MSPIHRLRSLIDEGSKGTLSSIDLSAATDRLPISLQIILIEELLSDIVPDSKLFAQA